MTTTGHFCPRTRSPFSDCNCNWLNVQVLTVVPSASQWWLLRFETLDENWREGDPRTQAFPVACMALVRHPDGCNAAEELAPMVEIGDATMRPVTVAERNDECSIIVGPGQRPFVVFNARTRERQLQVENGSWSGSDPVEVRETKDSLERFRSPGRLRLVGRV